MYSKEQSDLVAKWLVSNLSRDMASFIHVCCAFAPDLIWSLPFLTEKKGLQFHKEHQLDRTKLRLYISNNNNNVGDFFIRSYILFWFWSFSTSSPWNVLQICCLCVESKKSVLNRFPAVWHSRTLKLASLSSYNFNIQIKAGLSLVECILCTLTYQFHHLTLGDFFLSGSCLS